MLSALRSLAIGAAALLPAAAYANCNQTYSVQSGDTIFSIAERIYGDAEKWTLLYNANEDYLKRSVFQVSPGDAIYIPCDGTQAALEVVPGFDASAEMTLVTGSNFAPFTDTSWPALGMVTEVVNAALAAMPDPVSYSIKWENDWSQHLFPMLDEKQVDMGFPWYRPDCDADPANQRCESFHFSDPLVDVLVLLFVREGAGFRFDNDQDIVGKTLCRPQGAFTHDLDRAGREWVSRGLIRLVQADDAAGCFDALMAGRVDAVSMNLFEGATAIDQLGLRGQVVPLDRPVSTEGLHVVISKRHWRGTTHLYRFNAGLAALRETDQYNRIVARHLEIFRNRMATN